MEATMHRTGMMAPPTLYQLPPRPGLMTRDPHAVPHEVSLRSVLWCVAVVLGAVELVLKVLGL
jgi:hypothetical protein